MYVKSRAHVHTRSAFALAWVCSPIIVAGSLIGGIVNCVITVLQIWQQAMDVRESKAAPTEIHLSGKYCDYQDCAHHPAFLT